MLTIPNLPELSKKYRTAAPFPHIYIDDFLPRELALELAAKFPSTEAMAKVFREPMSYKGQTSDIAGKEPQFLPILSSMNCSLPNSASRYRR